MKTVIPYLFIIILIPALAKAQEDSSDFPHFQKYFADSSLSVITIERDTVHGFEVFKEIAKTQSYHLVHYWEDLNLKTMLISQTSTQTTNSNTDGEDGNISFIARMSDGGNFNKTVWTKAIRANNVTY